MHKNILKTFSLYVLYFILIVGSIYIFYKLFTNNLLKTKIQENYTPEPEGVVDNISSHNVMSIGDNNINDVASFKYNSTNGNYEPKHNFRDYNTQSIDNYYFFNRKLSESKPIEMTDGDTINLFLDYFDDIYDGENDILKPDFVDGILGPGFYVGNGEYPHYFLTFRYLLNKLHSFQIYPGSFQDQYEQVKKLCGFLCKKLGYSCVLCPKFAPNYAEKYEDWMFFVLVKQKTTKIKGSTSTSENNPTADLVTAGNIVLQGLVSMTQSPEFQNSAISGVNPTEIIMNSNPITNGILFYLGNSSNDITGIYSINSITITETGLQMIICDTDQISKPSSNDSSNDSNTGLIRDDTYLKSLTSVDKYFNSFRKELFIQYNDYNRLNSIPNPENEENEERTSALVLQRQNFWFWTWVEPVFIDNTETPLNFGNTSGYEHRYGNDSYNYTWRTLNKGLKGIPSVTGWNWSNNGRSFGASGKTTVSTKYFPKSGSINSCRNPKPFTFIQQNDNNSYNSYNIEIPPSQPESGEYELGIDTNKGTVYYKHGNSSPIILFSIEKYGLKAEHLATDYSWPDVEHYKGILKKGDVLGVNGGNKEYVMDREKKMRFWFDMHGTFHVEVSLSRNRDYIDSIVNAFQQKFGELFYFYKDERYSNNNYLNLLNYSGTPLTSKGAIMLLLMFSETIVSKPNNTDPINKIFGRDGDADEEDIPIFYKKIGHKQWSKDRDVGINSLNCKTWFKQANVYEDTINLGDDFPIPGIENNSQPISINQAGITSALDECSGDPICYAISCQTDSNICKLWDEDGIKNNYGTTPTYTNNTSDIYYKGCPNEVDILVQSRFQNKNEVPFSTTGVTFQSSGDNNKYNQGSDMPVTSEYMDHNDIQHHQLKKYAESNTKKWTRVFVKYNKEPKTLSHDHKIRFIIDKIKPYKHLIKIYTSDQTNPQRFYRNLEDQINTIILTGKYLNPEVATTSESTDQTLEENSMLTPESAKKSSDLVTSTSARSEAFSNFNDDYNTYNTYNNIMDKISDKIIKKIVYNIDDIEIINKFDHYNTTNFTNSIILSILLIILVIVFFNMLKNK